MFTLLQGSLYLERILQLTSIDQTPAFKSSWKADHPSEDHLQDIYEVLREKERAIERVRQEVEALRLACPLLLDENESLRITLSADVEPQQVEPQQEGSVIVPASDESAASFAEIHEQLADAPATASTEEAETNALLKFGQAALGASRTFLKRVRNAQWMDPEFQRKTVA